MFRKTPDVLVDLKELIYTPGYIYSLCLILYEDFHQDLNKIHEVNHRAKLSVKECSLIIGFLVKKEIDFSFPYTPEEAFERKEKTYRLMSELQMSFSAPQMEKLQQLMERRLKGEEFDDEWSDRQDFFVKDGGMIEPMFYAGDGVYDFQYMEYLESKYKYDQPWLSAHKNFNIDKVREIVKDIKALDGVKSKEVLPVNIKEIFPDIAAKARKKLKKKLSKEEIDQMEQQQLIAASFYRYINLFPIPKDLQSDNTDAWNIFYQNLLNLFVISPVELTTPDPREVESFFDNFSFSPVCNDTYEGPGYYNILNSRPLIKLDDRRYLLPIGYLLPEAVYESPFYWMLDDKSYVNSLAKHRGDVGEEIAYELLAKVFGKDHTYRSVIVENKKGNRETDIDVLCLLGNKALCVQVKSKKLTLGAKRGDFEQLSKDFKGAVQDAYDQGLVSRNAVLQQKARFINSDGKEICLPGHIDAVYVMGLTTENYPTLAHQVHMMLVKKPEDPYPLVVSAFDLELLVHYLADPYEFLYYVRQRTELMEYFRADEELVYLGYHLDQKLWPREGYDFVSLENDFGSIIDRNYYPFKLGLTHLLIEKDDPILNRWNDPQFDAFVNEIKSSNDPRKTDIVFHLLDWSGDARKGIVDKIHQLKQQSRTEGLKSLSTPAAAKFGLSYVVINSPDPAELEHRMTNYAHLRKYLNKSQTWLGLGSISSSPRLFDGLIYLDEPWQPDAAFEAEHKEELSKMKTTAKILMKRKSKVGRNDPCPCGSGKKYKQCCI